MKIGFFAQSLFAQSATQMEELDTVRVETDGRTFAYARAGATALLIGKLTQSAAPSANANDETIAASGSIGDTYVSVTFGGAVTANFYKDGYLWINDDTGEGQILRILNHAAGTTAVQVNLKDPVRVAFTTAVSTASCVQNRQDLVIIAPTTLSAPPIGVPPIAVTANYYFWNQVKGPAAVLTAGTVVIGNNVCALTTAGAIAPMATDSVLTPVGTVMAVNATTEYSLINLAIPGY